MGLNLSESNILRKLIELAMKKEGDIWYLKLIVLNME
jgi:hypothetical protein